MIIVRVDVPKDRTMVRWFWIIFSWFYDVSMRIPAFLWNENLQQLRRYSERVLNVSLLRWNELIYMIWLLLQFCFLESYGINTKHTHRLWYGFICRAKCLYKLFHTDQFSRYMQTYTRNWKPSEYTDFNALFNFPRVFYVRKHFSCASLKH
jgi:hypothetical protein